MWRPEPVIVDDVNVLYKTGGTKYANASTLSIIDKAKKYDTIAVVGTPCMMNALEKGTLFPMGAPFFKNIKYKIGLFCMESFPYEGVLNLIKEQFQTDFEKVTKMDISGGKFIIYLESGEELKVNHTWTDKGSYLIKCKAKDPYDAESDWKTLKVTMPKIKDYSIRQIQGEYLAKFGKRGNQRPIVYLNGSYHTRDRYFFVNGTVQTENHLGRIKGLFKGNHFIIRATIRNRVLTIIGRCSFDEEHQHFRGFWVGRGIPIRGWISGTFLPT